MGKLLKSCSRANANAEEKRSQQQEENTTAKLQILPREILEAIDKDSLESNVPLILLPDNGRQWQ